MAPRRLIALLELGCAVVAAGVLVAVGIGAEAAGGPERTPLDRAAPFVLACLVGGVLLAMARRSLRAAEQAERSPRRPTPPPAGSPPRHGVPPLSESDGADVRPAAEPPHRPVPALSASGRADADRVLAVLSAAGVLDLPLPDPGPIHRSVADQGEPVTAEIVLTAWGESGPPEPWRNLAFHVSHGEQFADVLDDQIADLLRLAGAGLADVAAEASVTAAAGTARVHHRVRLTVRDGERLLVYAGAATYLSTHLHVALARLLHERATGRRLAWLWSDEGVWITALAEGGVDALNAALDPARGDGWEWVDEQEPTAAGEMYPQPD